MPSSHKARGKLIKLTESGGLAMPSGRRAPLKMTIYGDVYIVMCAASRSLSAPCFFTWLRVPPHSLCKVGRRRSQPGWQPKLVFRCRARSFVRPQRRDEGEGELLYGRVWKMSKIARGTPRPVLLSDAESFFLKKANKKLTRAWKQICLIKYLRWGLAVNFKKLVALIKLWNMLPAINYV